MSEKISTSARVNEGITVKGCRQDQKPGFTRLTARRRKSDGSAATWRLSEFPLPAKTLRNGKLGDVPHRYCVTVTVTEFEVIMLLPLVYCA